METTEYWRGCDCGTSAEEIYRQGVELAQERSSDCRPQNWRGELPMAFEAHMMLPRALGAGYVAARFNVCLVGFYSRLIESFLAVSCFSHLE